MLIPALLLLAVSVVGCTWPWIGYPMSLVVRRRRRTLMIRAKDIEPSVSIIIPVFHHASTIGWKIENTLALDYPPELLEVIVVSDGATDDTNRIVERYEQADPRVKLVALPRAGKLVALQQGGRRAKGEILVFTDPTVALDPAALRQLVRNFAERFVGGVCGAMKVRRSRDGDATGIGASVFLRFENWIRRLESEIGTTYAADSSLYAIRRALFVPARNVAQADAFAISARVPLAGQRLIFEPRAICRREAPADGARDFRRKVHSINYTIRAILAIKWELLRNRTYGRLVFAHTFARYMVPFYLFGLLVASAALATTHIAFTVLLGVQVLGYVLAIAGWKLRARRIGRLPFFWLPCYAGLVNLASLLGLFSVLRGYRPLGARPRTATPVRRTAAQTT